MNPWLTGEKNLNELLSPPDLKGRSDLYHDIFDNQLPTGMAKVPFDLKIKDLMGITLQSEIMDFLDSFVGVSLDLNTLFLRPEIGRGVRIPGIPVTLS